MILQWIERKRNLKESDRLLKLIVRSSGKEKELLLFQYKMLGLLGYNGYKKLILKNIKNIGDYYD